MKSNVKRHLTSLVYILFIAYFVYVIVSQQPRIDTLLNQKQQLEKEISQQEQIRTKLEYYETIIETDEYIEIIARERLGYVKPGDIVFVDINDK